MGEEEVEVSMKNKVLSIKKLFIFLFFCLAVSGIFLLGGVKAQAASIGDVLINEISWMGTKASTYGEWIELRNVANSPVNVNGWTLYEGGGSIKIIDLTGTIDSGAYYLIKRTTASSPDPIPNIVADVSGSFGGSGLSNSGEHLALKDSAIPANIIDELNFSSGWPAGTASPDYKSMERDSNGWHTNDGVTKNGTDAGGNMINGTPKAANSAEITIINENTNSSNANISGNLNTSENNNANSNTNIDNAVNAQVLISIIFNEVYPNPPDESTEFIELKNTSGFAGSSMGWKIRDASGDEYNLPDKEIASGALWIVPKLESGISLNNDGETLSLINPAGAIAETLAIPAAPEGQSYARSGAESFEWTATMTAGAENVFTQAVSAAAEIAAPANTNSSASNINASNSNGLVNANTSASANTNSSKITIDFSAIKLSEIMPNPEGDDADGEWIELYNGGDKEIDLAGGSLSDASGKAYTISKNTIIAAKSYKVFYRKQTGIVLNNDQDAIDLKDGSGKKIDSVSYTDGAEGKSYALGKNGWLWSDPTPDKANPQAAEAGANANENTNSNSIKRVGATINEAKNAKSGAIITVSGIVTATFGEIAKNTFYIQDDTGGMAVVFESAALEISRGDFVVVKGKMKTSGGEKILSADDEKKITVQSSGNNSAAWQMNIGDIDSQSLGLFIGVNGKAVELTPKGFIIDDGSGSLAILPPGETSAEKGQIASVQGILKKTKDGIVLILRNKNDFISGNVLGESDQKNLSIAGNGKKYDIIIQLLIIIVTLLVGGYAARKYLQKYSYATSDTKPAEESKKDRDSDSGFGI